MKQKKLLLSFILFVVTLLGIILVIVPTSNNPYPLNQTQLVLDLVLSIISFISCIGSMVIAALGKMKGEISVGTCILLVLPNLFFLLWGGIILLSFLGALTTGHFPSFGLS